jgi:hypothetical protein
MMKEVGLRWKHPRYVNVAKDHIELKKGAIVRCLKQFRRPGDALLYENELLWSLVRLFS